MDKRVGIINEYYTTLKYDIKKKEALEKIYTLSSKLKFEDLNNFANRLTKTQSIIQANIFHFEAACEHIDVANNIINYLNYFVRNSKQLSHYKTSEFINNDELIASLCFTINNISLEPEVQNFLENAIIKGSKAEGVHRVTLEMYKSLGSSSLRHIEMILFKDSDLYSFMDCLKIENVVPSLNKIWVQISIEEVFQWHIKKYFGHLNVPIQIFQSKEELFTSEDFTTEMKIASIWSEDIEGAQNLASFLKKHIIFINTHINFCPIILPYTKILYDPRVAFNPVENEKTSEYDNKFILHSEKDEDKCYVECHDLFYDGKWQKPLKNVYWVHNNILLANATSEDYEKCKASAKQGFKIWSSRPIYFKIHVLNKLATILKNNNELSLADEVSKSLKLSLFCMDPKPCDDKTEQFEIRRVQDPRGIIVLKEKDKTVMFRRLIQSLITGNSIIVICDPDLCTLAPYCNMFLTAEIPPGVINLLSSKYVTYTYYKNDFEKLNVKQACKYFTASKHIVINCK